MGGGSKPAQQFGRENTTVLSDWLQSSGGGGNTDCLSNLEVLRAEDHGGTSFAKAVKWPWSSGKTPQSCPSGPEVWRAGHCGDVGEHHGCPSRGWGPRSQNSFLPQF